MIPFFFIGMIYPNSGKYWNMNLCLIPQTHTPNLQTVFLISGLTIVLQTLFKGGVAPMTFFNISINNGSTFACIVYSSDALGTRYKG